MPPLPKPPRKLAEYISQNKKKIVSTIDSKKNSNRSRKKELSDSTQQLLESVQSTSTSNIQDISLKCPEETRPLPEQSIQKNTKRDSTPKNPLQNPAEKQKTSSSSKLFVLDTNVLMHDPTALFRFDEHDILLPMTVLEELDEHKKGISEVSRNARQVSRFLDSLLATCTINDSLQEGILLNGLGHQEASGHLFFETQEYLSPKALNTYSLNYLEEKLDNKILHTVKLLQKNFPERQVTLVSKDINIRIKARTIGLLAEDYFNDQVLNDTDLLYSGIVQLPDDFWENTGKELDNWHKDNFTYYRLKDSFLSSLTLNQFVYSGAQSDQEFTGKIQEIQNDYVVLRSIRDFSHPKNSVWGITARNKEQGFALDLLMDPEIDFVTLLGQAGTGKTLLALAAGLAQVLDTKRYTEIIMTRATVPVGNDIGYLPGTEEEKMQPWMGALEDNLDVLNRADPAFGSWGRNSTHDLIRSRIKIKALSFMRGRTFIGKFLILDEAQNLTPKEMKTLITRAGSGTKVICLGNIAQIDTLYLTEGSSGLTYVVDRFKGWTHAGHIILQRGERSRLADFASESL